MNRNTSDDTPVKFRAIVGKPPSVYDYTKKIFSVEATVKDNTLWFMNKDVYNSYDVLPWISTGSDASTSKTFNSNFGYGGTGAKIFKLNDELYFMTNYLGFMNMALYKFNGDFTFNNVSGDNKWGTAKNWVAKNTPLDFDVVTLPSSLTP